MMDAIKEIRAVLPAQWPTVLDIGNEVPRAATVLDLLNMGMVLIGRLPGTTEWLFDCVRTADVSLPGRVVSDEGLRFNRYQRAPTAIQQRVYRVRVRRRKVGFFIREILDDLYGASSTWATLSPAQKAAVRLEARTRVQNERVPFGTPEPANAIVRELISLADINGGVVLEDEDIVEPHQWL